MSPKVPAYYYVFFYCNRVSMTLLNALLLDFDPQSWDTKQIIVAKPSQFLVVEAIDKFKINFWGLASRKCCTGTLT